MNDIYKQWKNVVPFKHSPIGRSIQTMVTWLTLRHNIEQGQHHRWLRAHKEIMKSRTQIHKTQYTYIPRCSSDFSRIGSSRTVTAFPLCLISWRVVDVIMCMPGCPNVGAKCNSVYGRYNEHNTDLRFRHPVLIVHQTHEINTHSNGNGQSHAPQEYKCN